MSEEYEKSTPRVRPVYRSDTGKVLAPDNKDVPSLEHRERPGVATPNQVDPSIFLEGGNAYVSAKTPAEVGITIKKRDGPATWETTR